MAALALLVLVAASCADEPPPPPAPVPTGFSQHFLTRDHADVTTLRATAAGVRASAPLTNADINSRTVLHRRDAAVNADHGACTTATHSGLPVQEGIALRIRHDSGRTRAITVTKNIWAYADTYYNVHTWDTARAPVLDQVAGHDMRQAVKGAGARRLCARVDGNTVRFKVWRVGSAEPAWNDAAHARSVTLPPGWSAAGRPGWYVGHLPPAGWANLTSLTVLGATPQTGPPATTTTTTTTTTSTSTSTSTTSSTTSTTTAPEPDEGEAPAGDG